MKKSLLALAVLGAYAGVASAQSSVTLYGTLDVNARYVKTDGQTRRLSEGTDGINSSQLALKATEDLGGGLKAGFDLRSGINPDTGTANAKFWNRRATVSLWGNFGEVRLGRDYTPTFWNMTIFDPFGTNGIGSSLINQLSTGTLVRADNTIGYFLPSGIGGVYGQAMVAASEAAATNPGRYVGGRIGWAGGPVDVAVAYATQRLDLTAGAPSEKTANVGASYDLGVVKLMGVFNRETLSYTGVDRKENKGTLGVVVPIGQSEIHAAYTLSKLTSNGVASKVDLVAVGYVYNLSKRTALYGTVARLNNKDATTYALPGSAGAATAGGKSNGVEAGLRHFF